MRSTPKPATFCSPGSARLNGTAPPLPAAANTGSTTDIGEAKAKSVALSRRRRLGEQTPAYLYAKKDWDDGALGL